MAPLVRRVLELLPDGGPDLEPLLTDQVPAAMRPRLQAGRLAAAGMPPSRRGHSALLVVSGPGIMDALVGVILHGNGRAYTIALRVEGGRLPPEIAAGEAGLDAAPPSFPESDRAARAWTEAALATLTRPAEALTDDHRWWGDVGALTMLADLVVEDPQGT